MKYLFVCALVFCVSLAALPAVAQVQEPEIPFREKSAGKAFALSVLVPGLGQRYVHDGSWRGSATVFGLADAALWLSLLGADWRQDQVIESYRTLAATQAGAQIDGKSRGFFLNLASYESSEAFREAMLRARAWDQVDYVSDPAFQWAWSSEDAFADYRDLRNEADAWNRRRTLFISALVANRLVAGLSALRAARRHNRNAPDLSLSFAPPSRGNDWPVATVRVQW